MSFNEYYKKWKKDNNINDNVNNNTQSTPNKQSSFSNYYEQWRENNNVTHKTQSSFSKYYENWKTNKERQQSKNEEVNDEPKENVINQMLFLSPEKQKELEEKLAQFKNQSQSVNSNQKEITNRTADNKIEVPKVQIANKQYEEQKQNKQVESIDKLVKDYKAKEKAEEINKNIQKGGADAVNATLENTVNNFSEGILGAIAGIANVPIMLGAGAIDGVEKIIPNSNSDIKNSLLNESNRIGNKFTKYTNANPYIKNDVIKTIGNISNTIGNMVPSIVSNIFLPGSGTVAQGLSVGGKTAQDSVNNEKDNIGQSIIKGAGYGTASGLIEKLTGGNVLGKGSLDDFATNFIGNKISSKLGQKIASKGYEFLGEELEEFLENQVDHAIDLAVEGKGVTKEEWLNEFNETNKNTFLTTAVLNLLGLGGNTYKEIQNNHNIDTNTKQAVSDINKAIKENNLGGKEQLEQFINNKLENSNSNLQQQSTQNEQILPTQKINQEQNNVAQNGNMEQILPTQKYYYEKSDNVKIDNLRQDVNKYFDNSEKTHNFVNMLEKIIEDKDINIRLDENLTDTNGNIANGKYDNGTITINPNSDRAGEFIAIHELTHAIGTDSMRNIIENYRKSNVEFDNAVKSLLKNYNTTELTDEAMADVSAQLFGNQEYINNLAQTNPSLFRKIYNEIKYLWHQFTGYKNQNQFLEDLKYKWEQAYRRNNELNDTSNYYIQPLEEFNEMQYNNTKGLKLNNIEEYALREIVNSDSNIKPGINKVETTNATYTIYYKSTDDFKVITRKVDKSAGKLNKRNDYTRGKARYSLPYSESNGNQETARSNDEISNINKTRESERTGSTTSSSDNIRNSIENSEKSSFNLSENMQKRLNELKSIDTSKMGFLERAKIKYEIRSLEAGFNTVEEYEKVEREKREKALKEAEKEREERRKKIKQQEKEHEGYQMTHRPTESGAYASDISANGFIPKDVYEHPEWYFDMNRDFSKESFEVIKKIKGNPEAEITIYRATPSNTINKGDWVTLSRKYAEYHNESNLGGKGNIVELRVKAKDIQYAGDDINEFGYFPENEKYSLTTKDWQSYLDKNIESKGTKTNLQDIKLPIKKQLLPTNNLANNQENSNKSSFSYDKINSKIDSKSNINKLTNNGIIMTYVHMNNQNTQNYGATYGQNIEPAGQYMNVDTMQGKYKVPGAEYGTIQFNNPLVLDHINTGETGWKKTLSDMFDNKTGKELSDAIKRGGYDGIITIDEDGYYNEVVNLSGKKLDSIANNQELDESSSINLAKNETIQEEKFPTRHEIIQENRETARENIKNISTWKDKKSGIRYQLETMERNMYDIIPDKAEAKKINDTYFEPIHTSEAEKQKFINNYNDRIRQFDLNKYESEAVQFLGEKKYNPDFYKGSQEDISARNEIASKINKNIENGKIDQEKVNNAIEEFRKIYDELFELENNTLRENGYKEKPYRKGYFPHFVDYVPETKTEKVLNKLGFKIDKRPLPTDIAGITEQFVPGKTWNRSALERKGNKTDYNALKGFDTYIAQASDNIFHTENIQRLRGLENEIRYQYSDKGVQERIDNILNDETLFEEEKQAMIDGILEQVENPMPNLVTELRRYTNALANKKSEADRSIENMIGRPIYSTVNAIENRFGANAVGLNIGSAITNFIPITQAYSQVSTKNMGRAIIDTVKSYANNDGFVDKSVFLTSRLNQSEKLYKTSLEKISDKTSFLFNAIDEVTSNIVVRGKYLENIQNGMSEAEAIKNADQFARNVIADRSKGALPTKFEEKNPVTKMFTQFQLEVNNQYRYMFKDLPRDLAEKGLAGIALAFFKMFVGAWVYNEASEKITGRKPAFSPIDLVSSSYKTITDKDMKTYDKVASIGTDIAEQLPFVGGLVGGGRIPVNGAIPDVGNLTKAGIGLATGEMDSNRAMNTIGKELSKPLYYLLPPFGGGQIKKSVEGIQTVAQGGSYGVDNKGEKTLQFPVENPNAGDYIKAGLFGKYALPKAKEYVDGDFKSLSAKDTKLYKNSKIDYGILKKYIADRDEKVNNKAKSQETKIKIIKNLPVSTDQKWEIYKSDIFSTTERKDGTTEKEEYEKLLKQGFSKSTLIQWYDINKIESKKDEEGKAIEGSSQGQKALAIMKMNVSDDQKNKMLSLITTSKNPETVNTLSRLEKSEQAYTDYFALNKSDTFFQTKISRDDMQDIQDLGINQDEFMKFAENISNINSEKDANGKTISGSKKKAVANYINSLNLSSGEKAILFAKAGYPDNSYKQAIYNYINGLNLSATRKKEIWDSLGYK